MNPAIKSWRCFIDRWLHDSPRRFIQVALFCHVSQLLLCLLIHSAPLAWLNAISSATYLFFLLIQKRAPVLVVTLSEIEIVLFALIASLLSGFYSGYFLYLISLLAISAFLGNIVQNRLATIAQVLDLQAIVILVSIEKNIPLQWMGIPPLQDRSLFILFTWNLMICVTTTLLSVHLSSQSLRQRNQELEAANLHLEYLASHDPLTGLQNRRNIHVLLSRLCEDANEKNTTFCLVMADVDDFKSFNDRYGHCHGDLVLTILADCIRSCIREDDIICRWGGEEILILFIDTPKDLAREILLRIQSQLSNLSCKSEPPLPHAVTLTFGLTEYVPGQSAKDLVAEADRLLYQGKQAGKNCVVG